MTPSSRDVSPIFGRAPPTIELEDRSDQQVRVGRAAAAALSLSPDRRRSTSALSFNTPDAFTSSAAFSPPWVHEVPDQGIDFGDPASTDQPLSTSPRVDSGFASSNPMPPGGFPSAPIGFNLVQTDQTGHLSARPYFPSTIPEFEARNQLPRRPFSTKEDGGLEMRSASSHRFPQADGRRSCPPLPHEREAYRAEARRSPSRGSFRRTASVTSLHFLPELGNSPQTPPSRPISRGSHGSPVRPLSRNSVSFDSARSLSGPPPSPSGEPPRLGRGNFFPEGVLFTRCLSGEVPFDAIRSIAGRNKDAFITTTEDYEHQGVGMNLPRGGEITQNDSARLIDSLALTEQSARSVNHHGLWLMTVGLGAKIAIATERGSSEANEHFVEPPEGSQCGRTATNSREWVLAEDSTFFWDDLRSGHVNLYRIKTTGSTEQWKPIGEVLMPTNEINRLSVEEWSRLITP